MGKRVILTLSILILIAGLTACSPSLKMSPRESFGTPTLTPFLQKATFTSTSTPILAVGEAESSDDTFSGSATPVAPEETNLEEDTEEPSPTSDSALDTPEPSLTPGSTQLPTSTKPPATTKPTKPPATAKPTKPPATTKPTDPPADTNTPLPPGDTNTPAPPTYTFTPSPTLVCAPSGNSSYESQVISLINAERTAEGLSTLAQNSSLTQAARRHSADMACTDNFSHTGSDGTAPWDRVSAAGYSWSRVTENIAASSYQYFSPASVVNMWMNSPGHKANILDANVIHIGVGFRYFDNGGYDAYYTANFAKP
jgi:uncharacterized protein YkwD